jgi:hypothetical protein
MHITDKLCDLMRAAEQQSNLHIEAVLMARNIQRLLPFYILLSSLLHTSFVVADSTCGSLITYRQYSTLLESAPQCFINGCTTNTTPSSMSDTCPQTVPCSELWGLFNKEYQQPWCSNCTKDVACRISGWPILNATAFCDITPETDTWLFGNQGSCCATGNQSYELARWVGQMCNGSEWRRPFDYYGGMAMLDWEEWLLPWNWTVRPENTTAVKLPHASCPGTPLALFGFFAENILYLIFAIGITGLKLGYIHGREAEWEWLQHFVEKCHPLSYLKFWELGFIKEWRLRRQQRRTQEKKFSNEVIFGIAWSTLMTGLQVGFNFVSAYLIKRSPGYQHVPLGHLALLLCCRPRLSWVACLLDHIGSTRLKNWFRIEKQREKAKRVLGSIGIGSAISEITLQGISSYYMVLTANTGRSRGFYIVHHLRPFWRGDVAQSMYLGALFWLIACIFLFLAWAFVFRYGVQTQNFIQDRINRIRNSLTKTKETVESRWKTFWQASNEPQPLGGDDNQAVPEDPGMVEGPGSDDAGEKIDPPLNNAPEEVERMRIHPPNHEERDEIERVPAHTTPNMTNEGDMNERVQGARDVMHGGDMNERINPTDQHQGPQAYGSGSETLVGQSALNSQMTSTAVNAGADIPNLPPGNGRRTQLREEFPTNNPFRTPENEPTQELQDQPDIEETPEQKEAKRKKRLGINIAFAVGLLAYIFQWMFWAGFVYTSGHRFVYYSTSFFSSLLMRCLGFVPQN